ncbi:MAG: hypothetical protein ACQESB_01880 [Elusimicrobiota bacterium]
MNEDKNNELDNEMPDEKNSGHEKEGEKEPKPSIDDISESFELSEENGIKEDSEADSHKNLNEGKSAGEIDIDGLDLIGEEDEGEKEKKAKPSIDEVAGSFELTEDEDKAPQNDSKKPAEKDDDVVEKEEAIYTPDNGNKKEPADYSLEGKSQDLPNDDFAGQEPEDFDDEDADLNELEFDEFEEPEDVRKKENIPDPVKKDREALQSTPEVEEEIRNIEESVDSLSEGEIDRQENAGLNVSEENEELSPEDIPEMEKVVTEDHDFEGNGGKKKKFKFFLFFFFILLIAGGAGYYYLNTIIERSPEEPVDFTPAPAVVEEADEKPLEEEKKDPREISPYLYLNAENIEKDLSEDIVSFVWNTSDDLSRVREFYKSRMPAMDFSIEKDDFNLEDHIAHLVFESEEKGVVAVILTEEEGVVSAQVSHIDN